MFFYDALILDFLFLFQDGATPLFKAAHKGYTHVVAELLKYKPSLGLLPVSRSKIQHSGH